MVDKAMTLKRYYKKKDSIRLEPMNNNVEPIMVDPNRQDVRILGVLDRRRPEVLTDRCRARGDSWARAIAKSKRT